MANGRALLARPCASAVSRRFCRDLRRISLFGSLIAQALFLLHLHGLQANWDGPALWAWAACLLTSLGVGVASALWALVAVRMLSWRMLVASALAFCVMAWMARMLVFEFPPNVTPNLYF